MYETHRMIGREHEADLEREAAARALAAEARDPARPGSGSSRHRSFIEQNYKARYAFTKRLTQAARPLRS
jgi:hypothetical protein